MALLFFILAFLFTVSSAEIEDGPAKEPRFCSLKADATNFTCDLITYSRSVGERSAPAVIGAVVIFAILTILIFLPCCCETCCDGKKNDEEFGTKRLIIPFIFVLLFLLTAIATGVYANLKGNGAVLETGHDLKLKYLEFSEIYQNITELLNNVSNQTDISSLQNELSDLDINYNTVDNSLNNSRLYRDIGAYTTAGLLLVLALIFLVYVITGNKFFFHCTGCVSWFVVTGFVIFVIVTSISGVVSQDLCQEVHTKPNGIFQLIYTNANSTYNEFENNTKSIIETQKKNACDYVEKSCLGITGAEQLCPCDTNNIASLLEKKVEDNGIDRTVAECANSCTSKDLKEVSQNIVQYVEDENFLLTLLDLTKQLLEVFGPDSLNGLFSKSVCVYNEVLIPLWIGCIFVFVGILLIQLILIGVERACCCLKKSPSSGDDYRKL